MKGRKVRYYLKDSFLHNQHEKNAGSKARNDVEAILISEGYKGYVSIEMCKVDNLVVLDEKMKYVAGIFQ